MTEDIIDKKRVDLGEIFSVRSDALKNLRKIVSLRNGFGGVIDSVARFSLVIDSNIVLGELFWLVAKRKKPEARTDLMELIEAETLDVYVPPKLLEEVEEKIPLIAEEKGLDLARIRAEWLEYRKKLKVSDPDKNEVDVLRQGVDPDDADFVALEKTILASGTFSKDSHIAMMGGNTISIECITHLRNYSRATAVELTIKVNGITLCFLGAGAIQAFVDACKVLVNRIASAPPWVKVLLLISLAYVVLNPTARQNTVNFLRASFSRLRETFPELLAVIAEIASIANNHKTEARLHLEKALEELERKSRNIKEKKVGTDDQSIETI